MVSLSDYKFRRNILKLSNKGLNVSTTQEYYDIEKLSNGFKEYFHSSMIRAQLCISEFQTDITHVLKNRKLTWTPMHSDPTVDIFVAAVSKDVKNETQKKLPN